MNKLEKGKKIGIVAASLASVALIGVGFSAWVIGFQNKETNGEVSVTADEVKYKSLTLSATVKSGDTLYLAGKSTLSTTTGPISFENRNNKEEDLKVEVTFTISVGKDLNTDLEKLKSISFAFDNSETYVDNKVDSGGNKLTSIRTGSDFSYIEAPETIDNLAFVESSSGESSSGDSSKFTLDQETSSANIKKYTLTKELEFHWGTFFKSSSETGSYGVNPVDYYAAVLTGEKLTDSNVQSAAEELEAMKAKYDGKKIINLKMTLNMQNSSTQTV